MILGERNSQTKPDPPYQVTKSLGPMLVSLLQKVRNIQDSKTINLIETDGILLI